MNRRVVITGGGTVSALGNSWATVRDALRSKTNSVRVMEEWEQYPDLKTRLAAPVQNFEMPERYTLKKTRSMGRVAKLGIIATEQALESAGLLNDPVIKNGMTGVSFGSATGSSDAALEFFNLLERQSMSKINGTTYLRMMSHTAAINISVCFGTTGRMQTTSTACTAGSQGIGFAYETIKSGQQDVMIAGGAEELCPTQAAVFDTVYAASVRNEQPESTPRPFDQARDGLVLGEGATTLILESYEHAMARNATILAEVVGFATNTDGKHIVRPNQAMMESVMAMALKSAELTATEIDYISAHGTGTEHGDIAESCATEQVMGNAVPISSLKSYTGHTLGACGAFEAWAGIHMMNEGWFAPTLNLVDVDPRCGNLDYIREENRTITATHFMSNNFAFGGVNTSLVFRKI
ncbi:MAG: beta-ketoacyl-ACP synthase [Acidiferrobacterales bacterium]|nr:beta-ketoacyl-ACP synthase [Acidiferrobacterales bacterium]